MADVEQLLTLLLGAGGAGGIAGVYNIVRTRAKGKLEDEETLIKRLDKDNKEKDAKINELENANSRLRGQRNKVWDQAARYRRKLIGRGEEEDQLEALAEFND